MEKSYITLNREQLRQLEDMCDLSPRTEVPGLEEDRAEIRQMAEELGLGWCIPDGEGS